MRNFRQRLLATRNLKLLRRLAALDGLKLKRDKKGWLLFHGDEVMTRGQWQTLTGRPQAGVLPGAPIDAPLALDIAGLVATLKYCEFRQNLGLKPLPPDDLLLKKKPTRIERSIIRSEGFIGFEDIVDRLERRR